MEAASAADKARDQLEDGEAKKGMVLEGRGCTDLFCLILFCVYWVGMFAVAGIAFSKGDAKRLIYGTDYLGGTCGLDTHVDRKRIVYPRTNEDLLLNMKGGKLSLSDPSAFKFYGICVSECPKERELTCNYVGDQIPADDADAKDWTAPFFPTASTADKLANAKSCAATGLMPKSGNGAQSSCSAPFLKAIGNNCWVSPADQKSTFFRCLPIYDKKVPKDQTKCLYPPEWESDPANANVSPISDDPLTTTGCIIVEVNNTQVIKRPAQPNILFDKINSAASLWGRWFGDLQRASWVILVCGIIIAVVISFAFLFFLKTCAGCMVWTTIFLTIIMSITITLFLYGKAGILSPELAQSLADQAGVNTAFSSEAVPQQLLKSDQNSEKFKYAAWVFTAGTIVLICLVIAVRKQIKDAIKIIKKASAAVGSRPFIIFYPLVTVAMLLALLMWWVYVAAAMFSAGDITTVDAAGEMQANLAAMPESLRKNFNSSISNFNSTMKEVKPLAITRYLAAYHFFGLLWTNQVIQGIGMMTIAGCVAAWYFEQGVEAAPAEEAEDGDSPATQRFPVFDTWKRTVRYHLGSIAFGGLLIAFFQFVRTVVHYIEEQMKKQGQDSRMVKMMMCMLKSVLWCMQKCMEVITRNAFIFIAIKGQSFCPAALKVVATVAMNPALMATVNAIGEIMMILARAFVTCTCGFLAFLILDNASQFQKGGADELTGTWMPVLFTLLFAYFTAAGFFYVFDIAMDTILIAFIVDKEENNGKAIHMDAGSFANKSRLKMEEEEEKGDDDEGEADQV